MNHLTYLAKTFDIVLTVWPGESDDGMHLNDAFGENMDDVGGDCPDEAGTLSAYKG